MSRKYLLLLALLASLRLSAQDETLQIAVNASLLPPLQKIEALYQEQFQGNLDLISASSGQLAAQILNGAPYEVFISADMQYPQKIYDAGLAQQPPRALVIGQLVFWSRSPIASVEEVLSSPSLQSVAIAQPSLAPYGRAAENWLKEHQRWEVVEPKLVYGESVSQVNQYIASWSVDAAFTAISAQALDSLKDKGHWKTLTLPKKDKSLEHGIVLLRNSDAPSFAVDQFLEFIISPVAAAVFQEYGYELP